MSFGSGGFGFGQSNTTQQPSAFGGGGFGAANTGSAFGGQSNTAFGANNNNNAGGGLFGGGAASTGGFGSTGGAFGSNNNSAFGANKTAFGSTGTAGGGLFGASSTTTATPSAFGGFGSSTTAAPATSAFGGGGSMFGASKPATTGAFGAGTTGTTGGSLFGGGSTTGGGFGSTTGGAFGATNNPGIGTNIGDPPGTNSVAFQPTVEKELNNSAQQNSFQNILFQEAYKKWSGDELRLVDYNQGRRFGNATGTGAFGVNSSFGSAGGFGNNNNTTGTGFGGNATGGGLFGNNTNNQTTTSAFAQPAATGSAFGGGGSGLFGAAQNKPATGGLFGSSAAQPAAQTGGLFGGSNTSAFGTGTTAATGGAFGSNATAGGGLFGGGANANAAKPAFGSFGAQQPATGTTGTGFGNTGAGFGTGATTTLFGNNNNQQTQQQGGGLFGNSAQTNTGNAFGGGGAFGNQTQQQGTNSLFGSQNKPAGGGLFGTAAPAANTGGGLFGNSNAGATTGAFGATNNQASGGLFGTAKPAATVGGGLFGNSANTQQGAIGGGLFGNAGGANQAQQQPSGGSSLFGGLGQSQQKPSLFGNSQAAGGGMFGNTNQQQQQGGGLFGGNQQQPALGNSMFGNSQNQAQPQALTTSLADMSAFGTSSLFAGVGANDVQNPGPLATPLSSAKKQPARASILPIYRLSKPQTPKRGFGFSYSTYASPSTPSSANSTPGGFGQSLLAGSLGRSLNKSISSSSLRRSFNAEDSILAPGAFSASAGPRNNGSMGRTKLIINRDIRSDLFSTPSKERQPPELVNARKVKRVSFDPSTATAAIEQGEIAPVDEMPSGSAEDLGYMRPTTRSNNGANGSSQSSKSDAGPEMEQVKGNELAIVHEEESPQRTPRSNTEGDAAASDYWMSPSKEDIQNMNRVQRQKVTGFTVGRHGIGQVQFRVPVDFSNINLDDIFVELVQFSPRSCTVYPNPAKKPAMGKGLNLPAEITLENSWPRGREKPGSRGHQKHIERLKRIPDTEFVDYNADTGAWVFRVEHFTTYGLGDEEDNDTDMNTTANQSDAQSESTEHPHQTQESDRGMVGDDNLYSFQRPQRHVPGAFDLATEAMDDVITDRRLSVRPPSPTGTSDSASDDIAADHVEDPVDLEMTTENDLESPETAMAQVTLHDSTYPPANSLPVLEAPAGIMRARMRAIRESTAPARYEVTGGDDWMDILKKSVNSGRPRDRAVLQITRELAANKIPEQPVREKPGSRRVVSDGRGFATSIDLMNSIFGKDKISTPDEGAAFVQPAKSFIKWPYQRHQDAAGSSDTDARQQQLRNSFKPRWGPDNKLIMARSPGHKQATGNLLQISTGISTQAREVWSIKLSHNSPKLGAKPHHRSWIATRAGPGNVPEVTQPEQVPLFRDIAKDLLDTASATSYEGQVWELASILFDPTEGPNEQVLRRRKLSEFWQKLVQGKTSIATAEADRSDEKAFLCLAGHQIADACKHLLDGKHYKLATLIPMVGTSDTATEDMAEQMQAWHDGDVLSEIETPLRAIYGLLAGDVAVCNGKTGAGSENRLDTLTLSNRFGLDWQQSFGLRLWYGIASGDDISKAIEKAEQDMERGLIPAPRPWYVEQDAREDKENSEGPQDLMWGLLKLYAGRAKLEDVLRPESCSPSHTDYSLCWQLGQLLSVAGKASFESRSTADSLTIFYGVQLMEKMDWSQAVTVLLHLSHRTSRAKAVRDVIARVAMEFANTPYNESLQSQQGVKQLLELEQFHIPKTWIAEACALAYRHLANGQDCTHPANFGLVVKEVRCLALAEQAQELQAAVVQRLDPLAILQWPPGRDMDRLVRYMKARPVNDGLADLAALAGGQGQDGQRQRTSEFDFDRYLAMLRKRHEETDGRDVVTLAALTTLCDWVETRKLVA